MKQKTAITNYLEVIENMKTYSFEKYGNFGIYDVIADQLREYKEHERIQLIKAYEAGFHAGYLANENSFLNNKPSGAAYYYNEYKNTKGNNEGETSGGKRSNES